PSHTTARLATPAAPGQSQLRCHVRARGRVAGNGPSGLRLIRGSRRGTVRTEGGAPTGGGRAVAVGAPAPGANMCRTGSHRGRCSYRGGCAVVVGAPAPHANACDTGSHRGGAPTGEGVL